MYRGEDDTEEKGYATGEDTYIMIMNEATCKKRWSSDCRIREEPYGYYHNAFQFGTATRLDPTLLCNQKRSLG